MAFADSFWKQRDPAGTAIQHRRLCRSCLPGSSFFAVQAQREALGAAAGFNEFGEGRFVRRVAAVFQVVVQLWATSVGDNMLADDDGVTSKRLSLFCSDRD